MSVRPLRFSKKANHLRHLCVKWIRPDGAHEFLQIRVSAHAGQLHPSRCNPAFKVYAVRNGSILIR